MLKSDPENLPNLLDGYLTREQLAKKTGRSERWWYRLELSKSGPPITRLGRTVVYRFVSVQEWLHKLETSQNSVEP